MEERKFKGSWFWLPVGFVVENWKWLLPLVSGFITARMAFLNAYLKAFAPFSYAIAFLIGALLTAGIIWLGTFAAEKWAKRRWWLHVTQSVPAINPLQNVFGSQRIDARGLADPEFRIIRGKRFQGCEILGARLTFFFTGCYLIRPEFFGSTFMSVPIEPGPMPSIENIFIFVDCHFTECKLYNMTALFCDHDARGIIEQTGSDAGWLVKPPAA